jgi:uncharacterized membrane protein
VPPDRIDRRYAGTVTTSSASVLESSPRRWLRAMLVLALVAQGINHFVLEEFFVMMIPAWLPQPRLLVIVSGIAEIVIGLAMLHPALRRSAGWAAIALFVAIFPANLEMALHPERWPAIPELALWIRLPFQLLFIYWAWAVCIAAPRRAGR